MRLRSEKYQGRFFFRDARDAALRRPDGAARPPYLQQLCNLHGVQRCTLEQLIARHPKREPIFKSAVNAHSAYLTIIFSSHAERHGIAVAPRIVHKFQARRFSKNFARLLD